MYLTSLYSQVFNVVLEIDLAIVTFIYNLRMVYGCRTWGYIYELTGDLQGPGA